MLSEEMGLVLSAGSTGCGVDGLMASLMRVLAFARLSMYDDGEMSQWWGLKLFVVVRTMRTWLCE